MGTQPDASDTRRDAAEKRSRPLIDSSAFDVLLLGAVGVASPLRLLQKRGAAGVRATVDTADNSKTWHAPRARPNGLTAEVATGAVILPSAGFAGRLAAERSAHIASAPPLAVRDAPVSRTPTRRLTRRPPGSSASCPTRNAHGRSCSATGRVGGIVAWTGCLEVDRLSVKPVPR
jgi:hypothetical protein